VHFEEESDLVSRSEEILIRHPALFVCREDRNDFTRIKLLDQLVRPCSQLITLLLARKPFEHEKAMIAIFIQFHLVSVTCHNKYYLLVEFFKIPVGLFIGYSCIDAAPELWLVLFQQFGGQESHLQVFQVSILPFEN